MSKDFDKYIDSANEALRRADIFLVGIEKDPIKPVVRQLYMAIENLIAAMNELNKKS